MYYHLSKQYHKYDTGGVVADPGALNQGLGIASTAAGLIDGLTPANEYGRKPMGTSIASGALKGAAMGAVAGPIGAGVGALVGGTAAYFAGKSAKKAEMRFQTAQQLNQNNWMRDRSQAVFAQNPELATGQQGATYFAAGGLLSRNYLSQMGAGGGTLSPMNSEAVEVNGPDHEQGGVDLPGNAEVEGGETMQDNFVFSKRLGFAQEHKKLAKAIGSIEEKKVMTPERVNSLKRLKDREQKLALSQEYLKHTMAHFGQPVE